MKGKEMYVYKAVLETSGDRNYARRVAEEAVKRDFVGYEMIIVEGKSLFMAELEPEQPFFDKEGKKK